MAKKYKNEIVRFEEGTPVELVLDVQPSEVKGKKMSGDYGDYISYMYYAEGNKMFFATQMLHDRLQSLNKGDKVVIEKNKVNDRVNWSINGSTSGGQRPTGGSSNNGSSDGLAMKVLMELSKISSDLELIKKHIYGDTAKKASFPDIEEEDADEADEDGLGF